jgi:hypothetical protein
LVFILKRKLFQKSFENVFECVRKEKGKKRENSFSALGRKPSSPAPYFSPSAQPHFLFAWAVRPSRLVERTG